MPNNEWVKPLWPNILFIYKDINGGRDFDIFEFCSSISGNMLPINTKNKKIKKSIDKILKLNKLEDIIKITSDTANEETM